MKRYLWLPVLMLAGILCSCSKVELAGITDVVYIDTPMSYTGLEVGSAIEVRLSEDCTAPQLEAELRNSMNGITMLNMDFEKLEYLSSAGLRVLLAAQKTMNKQATKAHLIDNIIVAMSYHSDNGLLQILNATMSREAFFQEVEAL